jgi:hypothetical protein
MMSEITHPNAQLLRGCIQNLRKVRCRRDFVFTANDRTNMATTAIAAGLTGLGGVAAGLGGDGNGYNGRGGPPRIRARRQVG